MQVFGKEVRRGENSIITSKVASYPNGDPISITSRVCVGKFDGPRVAMIGTQHGDEYNGMEVINRLMDKLNPETLSGSFVTVPVANPLAYNTAGRITPSNVGYENLNMNRVWPGDNQGLLTEKIVAELWSNIVENSDVILDMHEGGKAFLAKYIHARGTEETERIVGDHIKKLYNWFGQGIPVLSGIRTKSHMMGSLSIQAGLKNIPCIGIELGGGGVLWEEFVTIGIRGVKNIMIGLDMIQEEPAGQDLVQHVALESCWPKTYNGGFMYNNCELCSVVEKGELLGILKDTGGQFIEEIKAPYKSVIFDTRFLPIVYPGDWTFHCGWLP